jgi:hypothetical protein
MTVAMSSNITCILDVVALALQRGYSLEERRPSPQQYAALAVAPTHQQPVMLFIITLCRNAVF